MIYCHIQIILSPNYHFVSLSLHRPTDRLVGRTVFFLSFNCFFGLLSSPSSFVAPSVLSSFSFIQLWTYHFKRTYLYSDNILFVTKHEMDLPSLPPRSFSGH